MTNTDSNKDPQKKYWFIILIVVPIFVALISLTPHLLKKEEEKEFSGTSTSITTQKSSNIKQTTSNGHNFNNVQGNITITESGGEDEKKP